MAAPAVGGAVLALGGLAGHPVDGPWHRGVQVLLLVPAVLVHCHGRAERHGLGSAETAMVSVAAGLVAYAVGAAGLAFGAALTLAVVVAAQTGALAAASQLAGLMSLAVALHRRRTA